MLRVTNLIRKAHCALAKARWEGGRRVDVRQHAAGAAKRGLPFLLIEGHRLELLDIIRLLRPVLIAKGIVRAPRVAAASAAAAALEESAGGEGAAAEADGG